ncbi:hypothetical protein AB0H86_09675 [Streptomyces sp. NPDC050997]|uniref:hypothetical protein n=1 Tax=Streptomyces sp. NPDC050997 TaxID=3155519 RepID=UPI003416BAD7
MSQNASVTELTSQYTAQVAADLERNAKEQDRIGGEIAALQEQLAAIQADHTVLTNIQQAIGTAPASAAPAAPSDSVAVPAPRRKPATGSGTGKRTRTKKTGPQPGPAAAKKPAAVKTTAGKPAAEKPARKSAAEKPAGKSAAGKPATTKSAQPTLVDLVRRHLVEQNEPRSAAEITTALDQAHPERGVKTTVVRTTLEGLVAKSQAQRSKQGSSVFYTAPDAPKQAAPAKSEEQPAKADA